MIIKIIFWISAFFIMHTYILYPLLLIILNALSKRKSDLHIESYTPEVSVLMAVHNEEVVIREKIESLFSSEYPHDKMEVIVGSDSSEDSTVRILKELQAVYPDLKVIHFTERMGCN
jgi:cellulose synthase/poly-beta-1,6-N-acetylglucosamine synthase-like glycosyltransferase